MAIRHRIREWSNQCFEHAWSLGFYLTRPLWSTSTIRPFVADDRETVIVAPHPDDETIGAGGVAALHCLAGAPVTIIAVTDGGASRAGGLSPEEMVSRRAAELDRAVECLGVHQLLRLDVPERQADSDHVRTRLASLLSRAQLVYAPSCIDFHPDHLDVARAVARALQRGQTVRIYATGVPLTPLLVNLVADISPVADRKAAALECFTTQAGNLVPLRRLDHYRRILYRRQAVEVFWELPSTAYVRLIQHASWRWEETPFRGIRQDALTDPLAFLVGRRHRLHLRRESGGSRDETTVQGPANSA